MAKDDDLAATVEQFSALFGRMRSAAAPPATLSPETLSSLLVGQGDENAKTQRLAQHLAQHTPLTLEAARPIVAEAVSASGGDDQAVAQQLAQLAGLTGSVDLELSKPNPLPKWARAIFGIGMALILVAAVVLIAIAHSSGTAEYVALGILGGLGWLGSVLFVMGYQNVSVKGSSGSGSSAPASSSSPQWLASARGRAGPARCRGGDLVRQLIALGHEVSLSPAA